MGIVEGLTEFLPISSTGHLIVAAGVLRFSPADKDTFIVAIQAGAILAVCWHYRKRILAILTHLLSPGLEQRLAVNTVLAFVPAAIAGVLLAGFVQSRLFNPITVAVTLVVGGVIILWVEGRIKRLALHPRINDMDSMDWSDALKVGCMQCFALVPGMSRSGSTIIGGMLCGLSRQAATEFSFFLSIPTIFGATAYDLWKSRADLVDVNVTALMLGLVVSFVSALIVVKWLLRFVAHNSFAGFGWYRIFFGFIVLGACAAGII